jgi:hypothetical protein
MGEGTPGRSPHSRSCTCGRWNLLSAHARTQAPRQVTITIIIIIIIIIIITIIIIIIITIIIIIIIIIIIMRPHTARPFGARPPTVFEAGGRECVYCMAPHSTSTPRPPGPRRSATSTKQSSPEMHSCPV